MNLWLFKKVLLNGLKYFLYFFLVFFIGRVFFLLTYGNFAELSAYKVGLLKAFGMGARFDISAICYGFLPVAALWLVALFIPKNKEKNFAKFYGRFTKYYLLIVLFVFIFLITVDFLFFQFFQSHINTLFFGIFYDDTDAILHSVWSDYPIFKIVLIYVLTIVLFLLLSKRVNRSISAPIRQGKKGFAFILLLIIPLYVLGMRGSLGVFPLRRAYTNVSANKFVNSLCYNAAYSLKFANSERRDNQIKPDIAKTLADNGYESIEQVQSIYKKGLGAVFDSKLQTKTPYNAFLKKHPPNVIFFQMESMSNQYFGLSNKQLNLLGDLSEELPYLYYFKNGLSSFNNTIRSLENFLIGTPKNIVSQSPYFDTPFSSSITLPFKSKGYTTRFLSGANISWRNIDKFLEHQSWDEIGGGNLIKEKYPNAEESTWGVYDGYLFDYIQDILKHHTQHPQFIFGLTISNHTPFELPDNFKPYPIKMDNKMKNEIRVDEKTAYKNFTSYQYAASQLARFIKDIRQSPLGKNTIIVVTGDHNVRQIFKYTPEEGFLKRSVPILMYIPNQYKPDYFNDRIMVSHKDIFPTIYNLSLSNASYTYTGDDMFKKDQPYRFAINGYNFMADSIGVVAIENNKPYYYTWADKNKLLLKVDNVKSEHALFMLQKMKAYKTMQTIKIYQDIQSHLDQKKK